MALTYGASGQPAASTYNYDALVATSLANYRKTLIDNISRSSAFYSKIKWDPADGGLHVAEPLMYGLAPVDTYDGYDELSLAPTNGITQAQFDWAQASAPVSISEKERKQNKHNLVSLVDAKIMQAEMAFQEFYPKGLMQGSLLSGGSSLTSPYTSPVNGSSFVTPLPALVYYAPSDVWTGNLVVGGIDQTTNTWWRNVSKTSAATTYLGFMDEILNLYNTCSIGPGGPPDLAVCDQKTWELLHRAYREYYQNNARTDGNFPFPNLMFFNTPITWDVYVPDVANGTLTPDTGKGTFYFLNTKFFKCRPESETNFVATDFMKPVNQDVKVKHILWMGTVTVNNRRKHGVMGNIARSLT